MADTYQAVYDAVRSKISSCDMQSAIESAINGQNIGYYVDRAMTIVAENASEHARPSVIFKPLLSKDGNQWCALFGDNLEVGVAGFGDTPEKAMRNFDHNWYNEKAVRNG